jgi:hypothetical protein
MAVCFGDRTGLTVFLASLAFFVATWRVGLLINDSATVVQTLQSVAQGRMALGAAGDVRLFPGMHVVDGQVYGRNYGQVVLALPVLWALQAVASVGSVQIAIGICWSGLVVAIGVLVGDHVDARRRGLIAGGVVGVLALALNGWFLRPLELTQPFVMALQASTMLGAALIAVFLYRLVARRSTTTLGVIAAGVTVLGTPVGFWASVPKRHTLTALFVVLAVYAFSRSRVEPTDSGVRATVFRALAYASAGLLTWVHAPEGLTLFLALVIVDVPTAPRNDPRTLAAVGAVFFVSLLPFLVTNALISGNPFRPPRYLGGGSFGLDQLPTPEGERGPVNRSQTATPGGGDTGSTPGGSDTGSTPGGSDTGSTPVDGGPSALETLGWSFLSLIFVAVGEVQSLASNAIGVYNSGLGTLSSQPSRLYTSFIFWHQHSWTVGGVFLGGGTNLSVLQSAPVFGALVSLPLGARLLPDHRRNGRLRDRLEPTDLFVVLLTVLYVVIYIDRLPLPVMVTVRYIHPIYPLLVYALFRQPRIQRLIQSHTGTGLGAYAATVVLASAALFWLLLTGDYSKGAVFKDFGLVALASAGALAVSLFATEYSERADRVAACSFGLTTGLVTTFLLVTAFVLLHYGSSPLPAVEFFSGELRFRILTNL